MGRVVERLHDRCSAGDRGQRRAAAPRVRRAGGADDVAAAILGRGEEAGCADRSAARAPGHRRVRGAGHRRRELLRAARRQTRGQRLDANDDRRDAAPASTADADDCAAARTAEADDCATASTADTGDCAAPSTAHIGASRAASSTAAGTAVGAVAGTSNTALTAKHEHRKNNCRYFSGNETPHAAIVLQLMFRGNHRSAAMRRKNLRLS